MTKKDFYIDIHPGEILAGILEDAELSQSDLARAIGSSRRVISEICTEKGASLPKWLLSLEKH